MNDLEAKINKHKLRGFTHTWMRQVCDQQHISCAGKIDIRTVCHLNICVVEERHNGTCNSVQIRPSTVVSCERLEMALETHFLSVYVHVYISLGRIHFQIVTITKSILNVKKSWNNLVWFTESFPQNMIYTNLYLARLWRNLVASLIHALFRVLEPTSTM